MDKGLHGARAVMAITGAPPLAVIPRSRPVGPSSPSQTALGLDCGGRLRPGRRRPAVHFFWKPLDILWFTLLRRIEVLMPAFTGQP